MRRTLTVWCPDWPVVAWRRAAPSSRAGVPVAILERGERGAVVRAASAEARAEGVVRGLRRREAQARCPGLVVADADLATEVAAFEEVARACEDLTPRLELERPGVLAFPTLGPSRYFGGDVALARRVVEVITTSGIDDVRVGIADSGFASRLAARRARAGDACVIEPGGSAHFVAGWPVAALDDAELTRLLERLGLRTLGDFAALAEGAVLARFGPDGVRAQRRARAVDDDAPVLTAPPPELARTHEFDPPVEQIDIGAFAAKTLADELLEDLASRGWACTRVVIEAETEHGETLSRRWRHEGALSALALATRVRWQLEGWLTAGGVTAGLVLLRLVPDDVVPAGGRQLGFWGGDAAAADRATRALVRVQGMLGIDAVVRAVPAGGRTPDERVRWVPWGEREIPEASEAPWPGRVPGPAPARVHVPGVPAELLDADACPVVVSARGLASAHPATLRSTVVSGRVSAWAGPWPHDVRWWDRVTRRRGVLWQLVVDDTTACLVQVTGSSATVTARYD